VTGLITGVRERLAQPGRFPRNSVHIGVRQPAIGVNSIANRASAGSTCGDTGKTLAGPDPAGPDRVRPKYHVGEQIFADTALLSRSSRLLRGTGAWAGGASHRHESSADRAGTRRRPSGHRL
jgi:hypothetical protein